MLKRKFNLECSLSTENVLIWPKEYPLLLKGLLEQNGAFILDALEAWPQCDTAVDEQGIESTILPPLYYLLWQKPAEPFEQCFFQHIYEFDDELLTYVESAYQHLVTQLEHKEAIAELLLERIAPYASTSEQVKMATPVSLTGLCMHLRFFKVFNLLLKQGLTLSDQDTLAVWQDDDFRELSLEYIKQGTTLRTPDTLIDIISEELNQGGDFFDLLIAIKGEDYDHHILEKALLAHIQRDDAMQSVCIRFLEQGAKGTLLDANGMSAAMWAAKKGFASLLAQLLDKDTINNQDHHGNTVLHYCVYSLNEECVSLSLNGGINYHLVNKDGLSPYRLAVAEKYDTVVKQFEQKFGIKELSNEEKMKRIKVVHLLHALIIFLSPLQLFFIFTEQLTIKSEISFVITLSSMIMMFYALTLKSSSLYPNFKHPFSLTLLRVLSPLAIALQLIISVIIVISVLS